jgi:hypothetical protein
VGFVTREFAHLETVERAKRWLIEVGFHPSRIEIHVHGMPRITVSVEPGQAEEVNRVLDAAALSDPEGSPSFWDHPHHHHTDTKQAMAAPTASSPLDSQTFDIGWRPADIERDVSQTSTEIQKQKEYRERHD